MHSSGTGPSDPKSSAMGCRQPWLVQLSSAISKRVCFHLFLSVCIFILCLSAEKALAVLQARSIPNTNPPVSLALSPFPPTSPSVPLPPPAAHPRIVKHLPPGYSDSQLYDLFRPFGALASVRAHTQFGADTGVIEFWNEDDARQAEEAMHCADVEGQNIAVQIYTPRRASGSLVDFNIAAPAFVPTNSQFGTFSAQVCLVSRAMIGKADCVGHSTRHRHHDLHHSLLSDHQDHLSMALGNRFSSLR